MHILDSIDFFCHSLNGMADRGQNLFNFSFYLSQIGIAFGLVAIEAVGVCVSVFLLGKAIALF
jgi:hypothetical protein